MCIFEHPCSEAEDSGTADETCFAEGSDGCWHIVTGEGWTGVGSEGLKLRKTGKTVCPASMPELLSSNFPEMFKSLVTRFADQ